MHTPMATSPPQTARSRAAAALLTTTTTSPKRQRRVLGGPTGRLRSRLVFVSTSHQPLATSHYPVSTISFPLSTRPYLPARRGITLIEVLISMGVLLIGLLGVGAMLPAGRYEIMQGVKADYAAMMGREAYRDMKARGYLDPRNWGTDNGGVFTSTWNPATSSFLPPPTFTAAPLMPAVIDPLGLTAATSFGNTFPYGASLPLALVRIYPNLYFGSPIPANNRYLADAVFRCPDDLQLQPDVTPGRDRPPVQASVPYNQNPLFPVNPILKRSSDGTYSWLATIVPDPTKPATESTMTVSVAVIYKRDLSTPTAAEYYTNVSLPVPGLWTGELILTYAPGTKALRPGNYIMLAGSLSGNNYFRWYRVHSAAPVDTVAGTQAITVAGPDWNPATTNTAAWIIGNVIGVCEKNIRLDMN